MITLICGLGGGLDIMNCLPFKFLAEEEDHDVILGSIRPLKYEDAFDYWVSEQFYCIRKDSKVTYKGRFADPKLAEILDEELFVFSRYDKSGKRNVEGLAKSFDLFCKVYAVDQIIFVDGGGDSMILVPEDIIDKNHKSPFDGGDAFALEAISKMEFDGPMALFTVATGLDVNYENFEKRLIELNKEGIYPAVSRVYVDLFCVGALNSKRYSDMNDKYNSIAEKILYLDERDPNKFKSHTATVLYHSINRNYGIRRTYVPWEGKVGDEPGVVVLPHHALAFEFDAKKIHNYKLKLNSD
jgi:hypothetical protein